jgi:uncharacterized protein (TIGR02145 family)
MKKVLLCAAFIAASFTSIAQVGVGTVTPDASAALDITTTTAGLLPPRMTTAERDVINNGVWAEGLTIYNTDTKCLELYNGTDWISVCDGSVVTTPPPPNSNLTVASPTYQGTSVIDATGIGYNGEAVPSASTITVQLTNTVASSQNYGLSATDAVSGLVYSASGTIAASASNIAVILTPNAVVMPALESGVLTMPLTGASNTINLVPRIDIKSIPASATTVTDVDYGGQTWMDRNLGARRVATVDAPNGFTGINDVFSYGNYYQWGRPADGHEITVWNGTSRTAGRGLADVTADLAGDAYPAHGNFIITNASPNDWLATPATSGTATLWATANQGPCPANYHVPTDAEWSTAYTAALGSGNGTDGGDTAGWDNNVETYESALKLPSSGYRDRANGTLSSQGTLGLYWSSTVSGTDASYLYFNSTEAVTHYFEFRAYGFTVRCLKD